MAKVYLESTDKEKFPVEADVLKRVSGMFKDMFENCTDDSDPEAPIPVQDVNSKVMEAFIEWSVHHKDDPPPKENENAEKNSDDISEWDLAFFKKLDQATLVDLTVAARFLQVDGLLETCCKTIANMMKGRTPAQLRKLLNIPESELEGFVTDDGPEA